MAIIERSNTGCFSATFGDPDDLLQAVAHLRAKGVKVVDTYSPFPVHGMDAALGLGHSRISYACAAFASLGLVCAAALQYWTSVLDYPLVVGGKPLNSIPAFIPVGFELTVLFAGLGTVATLLALNRLRPRLKVPKLFIGSSDDHFILLAEIPCGTTLEDLQQQLLPFSVRSLERYFEPLHGASGILDRKVGMVASALAVILPPALVLGLGLAINRDFSKRVMEFDAGMLRPMAAQAYDSSPVLPNGQVLQAHLEGTVARGQAKPLAFSAGKEEAIRAGEQLKNPVPPTPVNLARGEVMWNRVCATCHGSGGKGDGGVIPRFPNPPNLLIPKYFDYPEGRIFHVATFGGPEKIMQGLADQISAEDRWKAILYLRTMQAEAAKASAAQAAKPSAPAPTPAATGAKP